MIDLRFSATDRTCGRCAPLIILRRVAGLAFNFSSIDLDDKLIEKSLPASQTSEPDLAATVP